jgi:hypothetical protein
MLGGIMGNGGPYNYRNGSAEFIWAPDAEKNSGWESTEAKTVDWTDDSSQSNAFVPIDHFMI